jgi:hypothetical protein
MDGDPVLDLATPVLRAFPPDSRQCAGRCRITGMEEAFEGSY